MTMDQLGTKMERLSRYLWLIAIILGAIILVMLVSKDADAGQAPIVMQERPAHPSQLSYPWQYMVCRDNPFTAYCQFRSPADAALAKQRWVLRTLAHGTVEARPDATFGPKFYPWYRTSQEPQDPQEGGRMDQREGLLRPGEEGPGRPEGSLAGGDEQREAALLLLRWIASGDQARSGDD